MINSAGAAISSQQKLRKHCGILNLVSSSLSSKAYKLRFSILTTILLPCCMGRTFTEYTATAIYNTKEIDTNHIERRRYDHTNPWFIQHKILKIRGINTYCKAMFVYKSIGANNSLFEFCSNNHYLLRNESAKANLTVTNFLNISRRQSPAAVTSPGLYETSRLSRLSRTH